MTSDRPSLRKRLNCHRIAALAGIPGLRAGTMDRALVYPDLGLVYNRIKKSGNSSIVLYLQDVVRGQRNEAEAGELDRSAYVSQLRAARSAGWRLTDLSMGELRQVRDYYAFTVFRSPYSRCLSAFLDKVAPPRKRRRNVPGAGRDDPEGFAEFIGFLETGGLYTNKHFWPQCDLLIAPPEYFAFIGQLERLQEALAHVLAEVGRDLPASLDASQPHVVEQRAQERVTGADARMKWYYTEPLYERVHALYQRDFELGGYDPAWRPAS